MKKSNRSASAQPNPKNPYGMFVPGPALATRSDNDATSCHSRAAGRKPLFIAFSMIFMVFQWFSIGFGCCPGTAPLRHRRVPKGGAPAPPLHRGLECPKGEPPVHLCQRCLKGEPPLSPFVQTGRVTGPGPIFMEFPFIFIDFSWFSLGFQCFAVKASRRRVSAGALKIQ